MLIISRRGKMGIPRIPYISRSFENAKRLYNSLVTIKSTDANPNSFSERELVNAGNTLAEFLSSSRPKNISESALVQLMGDLDAMITTMETGLKTTTNYFENGTIRKLRDGTCRKVAGSTDYSEVGIAFYLYGKGSTFRAEVIQGDTAVGTSPVYEEVVCPDKKKKHPRTINSGTRS
jgi:hypothetical protein